MASDYPPKNGARRRASQARSYEDFFRDVVFKEENRRERARQGITARSDSPDFWRQLFDGPDRNRVPNTGNAKALPDPPKDRNPIPEGTTGPQVPYPPKRPSILESGGSIMTTEARHQPNPPKPEPMPAPHRETTLRPTPLKAATPAPATRPAPQAQAPAPKQTGAHHPKRNGQTPPLSTQAPATESGTPPRQQTAPQAAQEGDGTSGGPIDLRSPIGLRDILLSPFPHVTLGKALARGVTKQAAKGKLDGDADDMLQAFSKRIHGEKGHTEIMDFKHVDTKGVEPDHFPGFKEKLEELRKKGGGTVDISLAKDHSTSGTQKEVLGNMRLKLEGKLTVNDKGWKFDGGLGAAKHDVYNFDPKPKGARTDAAEIATAIGAKFKGIPYKIEFKGTKPINKEHTW